MEGRAGGESERGIEAKGGCWLFCRAAAGGLCFKIRHLKHTHSFSSVVPDMSSAGWLALNRLPSPSWLLHPCLHPPLASLWPLDVPIILYSLMQCGKNCAVGSRWRNVKKRKNNWVARGREDEGGENKGKEDMDGADPSLRTLQCTLSRVSTAFYHRPKAPGFPGKLPARGFVTERACWWKVGILESTKLIERRRDVLEEKHEGETRSPGVVWEGMTGEAPLCNYSWKAPVLQLPHIWNTDDLINERSKQC